MDPDPYRAYQPWVIYRCVVGSRAQGLDQPGSDTDRRGIYLPPADLHWSLAGVPEQLESDADQACYWELAKFLHLALKANPNILECLFTPLVEYADPLAAELLARRAAFLSRRVHGTYDGYARSQFAKLEDDLRLVGTPGRPAAPDGLPLPARKHAMHMIRLLIQGVAILETGTLPVRVEAARDRLLAIRAGTMPFGEIDAWRRELHAAFDRALATTALPAEPDTRAADAFLIRARRSRL